MERHVTQEVSSEREADRQMGGQAVFIFAYVVSGLASVLNASDEESSTASHK